MSTCCLPYTFHEGTPAGKLEHVFGLDSYTVGDSSSSKIIVLLTDIYGHKFKNVQLIADIISKEGYYVVIPDILGGEVASSDWTWEQLMPWVSARNSSVTGPIVQNYLQHIRDEKSPKFLGSIGYCFGAKYVLLQLGADGLLDAGAIAHPSLSEVGEYEALQKPLVLSCAQTDQMFSTEARHDAELAALATGVEFQLTVFAGVAHGFAVKGDYSVEKIRYAGQKALKDHIDWFNRFSA